MTTRAAGPARPRPTIDELIDRYLAEIAATRKDRRDDAEGSLALLRDGLDGYAYQYLSRADEARWSAAFNEGDEAAFCRLFGATYIVKYLDEFLGYFLIRKVLMHEEEIALTVDHVRDFVTWLGRTGAISATASRRSLGRLAAAAVDLPAAERLGHLLYELGRKQAEAIGPGGEPDFDEIVDDFLVIERVAPGRLWFVDGVGPVKVPEAASAIARPGWTVNIVLGRHGSTWELLEVGNVYPETLA